LLYQRNIYDSNNYKGGGDMKKKALLLMLVLMFISTNALAQHYIQGKMSGDVQAGISIELYLVVSCGGDELVDTVTTNSDGYYFWENLADGNYKVVPDNESYNFTPESKNFTIPRTDFYNKNFTAVFERFIDNNDGTVTDTITGLIWLNDTNTDSCFPDKYNQDTGESLVGFLSDGYCGLSDNSMYGDWRLPTEKEWADLGFIPPMASYTGADYDSWIFNNNDGLLNIIHDNIYSGYHFTGGNGKFVFFTSDTYLWQFSIQGFDGELLFDKGMQIERWCHEWLPVPGDPVCAYPELNNHKVRPVRDPIIPPCDTVDRFLDHGDGTVTDCRTDLLWLKDANCFGAHDWDTATLNIPDGVIYACDVSIGAGDWRLPTKEELQGIGTDPPTTWSGAPPVDTWTMPGAPFTNIEMGGHWSSTEEGANFAWDTSMINGVTGVERKEVENVAWPVLDAN
jgi:hypothetical protein